MITNCIEFFHSQRNGALAGVCQSIRLLLTIRFELWVGSQMLLPQVAVVKR
jgi:hypothetical protein